MKKYKQSHRAASLVANDNFQNVGDKLDLDVFGHQNSDSLRFQWLYTFVIDKNYKGNLCTQSLRKLSYWQELLPSDTSTIVKKE